MLKSLYGKLALAFIAVAFTTALLVAVFIRLTSVDRLRQLVIDQQRSRLEQSLSNYYALNSSWTGVDQSWQQIQSQTFSTSAGQFNGPPPQGNRPPEGQGRGNFMGLADAQGAVIVSVDSNYPAGSTLPPEKLKSGTPVLASGVRVGTILMASQPPGLTRKKRNS